MNLTIGTEIEDLIPLIILRLSYKLVDFCNLLLHVY